MIKSSLVILKANIGRDVPSLGEFELCAQKIVSLVSEEKDPIPPILQDTFKQWVSIYLEGTVGKPMYDYNCTCHIKFQV